MRNIGPRRPVHGRFKDLLYAYLTAVNSLLIVHASTFRIMQLCAYSFSFYKKIYVFDFREGQISPLTHIAFCIILLKMISLKYRNVVSSIMKEWKNKQKYEKYNNLP